VSPRLTTEDLFAWKRLFEALGGAQVGVRRIVRGQDDGILVRADKGANAAGASWLFGDAPEARVIEAAGKGDLAALLVVGDNLDPADTLALAPAVRAKVGAVVFAGPFVSGAAETASVLLPGTAWAEEDGTIANFEGRIQRVRRARTPWGEARPGWRIAADIAEAAGVPFPGWTSAEQVLADVAAAVPQYEGLDGEAVGLLGVPARAAARA
jgi:NADH dehydrogenase/NADH:ubiquinone oxidoreductase subunit G